VAVEALTKEPNTMDGQKLQQIAGDCAADLPDTDLERRSAPDWDLYKVRGKVFMLMTELPGHPVVILKSDPDHAAALREQHSDITPGYHMDKKHWITVEGGGTVDEELVKELVLDSYRLVVEGLPRSRRPAVPDTRDRDSRPSPTEV
jgi:predicted DNA-binding protein (MmcQ/YjbR family)